MAGRMDCGALRLAGRAAGTTGATAMNCDPAELASLSRCYCFGSKWRSVLAYIYCQWANNLTPSYPCGVPSHRIKISGAGSSGANQFYSWVNDNLWSGETDPNWQLGHIAGFPWVVRLLGIPSQFYYFSPELEFPCPWSLDDERGGTGVGSLPSPTGQYV